MARIPDADKQKCISEAKRVCKDGGKIFFAFISNDFVFLTEFGYDVNYFSNGDYNKETFKLNDFPFVFHTVGAARKLAAWWNDGAVMAHAGFPNGLGTSEEEVIEGLGNGRMVIEESDRAQHVYESLGFRKVRTNIDSWKDQLGRLQSSVDYELVENEFVSYIK